MPLDTEVSEYTGNNSTLTVARREGSRGPAKQAKMLRIKLPRIKRAWMKIFSINESKVSGKKS
jgi:hypothetical protein